MENCYQISMLDFESVKFLIGNGTFSEVYIVNWRLNDYKYALKVLNKQKIKDSWYEKYVLREKEILNMLDHQNIIRLEHYFQDSDNCYLLLELWEFGDLATLIRNNTKLTSKLTREFTMEIVSALEEMRAKNVVHRDLKPHNILLDDTYHIKLADFGAAKIIDPKEVKKEILSKDFADDSSDEEWMNSSANTSITDAINGNVSRDQETINIVEQCQMTTQIGSLLYISPEMLKYQIAWFASDLWALGCIIYQCLTGTPPFMGNKRFEVENKIKECDYKFTDNFDHDAKDLISKLLLPNPLERLGAGEDGTKNSMKMLKMHPYFKKESFKRCAYRVPSVCTLKKLSSDSLSNLYNICKVTASETGEDIHSSNSIYSLEKTRELQTSHLKVQPLSARTKKVTVTEKRKPKTPLDSKFVPTKKVSPHVISLDADISFDSPKSKSKFWTLKILTTEKNDGGKPKMTSKGKTKIVL
jgi:serine/threonine protein kinase